MDVPLAYQEGWGRARVAAPEAADRYVRHTVVGDPGPTR